MKIRMIGWVGLLLQPLVAEITMAPLFQDGGVLQRERAAPVWGEAEPGGKVTVNFAGQTKTTTANAAGKWQVELAAMPASMESRTMSVSENGKPPVEIKDLWVGEVWLASGQSNMQWNIKSSRQEDQAMAAAGPVAGLRLFQVPRGLSSVRQTKVVAKWTPATPETAVEFSAVGYFFGRRLAEELKVPVGIVHSSWGGSRIEPWWAEEGLEGIAELAAVREQRLAKSPGFEPYDKKFRGYLLETREWADGALKAVDAGGEVSQAPKAPELLKIGHNQETGTYQAMIHPLVPYALRGMIWYQGESNNGEGMLYTSKMRALIGGWRKQFRAPEAPFLFVQLAPYHYGADKDLNLPGIWMAQQESLKIPHTGMAVVNDIGNIKNIHPTNKSEVARRLALWAMADTYGRKDIVKSGPLYSGYEKKDGGIVVKYDFTGGGLVTRDGKEPSHFEIAGMDGVFHAAEAQVSQDGRTVFLKSAVVAEPQQARFAWSQVAEPNLMNREGLPSGAFHTHFAVQGAR